MSKLIPTSYIFFSYRHTRADHFSSSCASPPLPPLLGLGEGHSEQLGEVDRTLAPKLAMTVIQIPSISLIARALWQLRPAHLRRILRPPILPNK